VADLQALHALIADSRRARYPVTKGPSEQASAPRDVLRVGLLEGFCADVVHDEVTATVLRTARAFEGLGVLVEPRDGRGIEDARRVWMDVCTPEFADAHPLLKDPGRRRLGSAQVVEWLERGERVTSNEREVAARHREEIRRWYLDRLEGLDAVLIPTTPYPAPGADQKIVRLGERRTVDVSRVGPGYITSSVNLAGLPALNLPAGRSSEGMPIGVSLIAAVDGEATLFRLATLWEEGTGYRPERPPPRTA